MALKDVIAQRYRDYITIEGVLKLIAKDYACSEEDALMVLSDAIKSNASRNIQGKFICELSFFNKSKLGPNLIDNSEKSVVLENLCKSNVSAREALGFDIPF